MRRIVKFLHSLAACGLIGALAAHAVVLVAAPQDTPQAFAAMRQTLAVIASHLLVPSLAVALVSGLVSMLAHSPFIEARWVWLKALLGLALFEGTLAFSQGKGALAAEAAMEVAAGQGQPGAIQALVAGEWQSLAVIMALSLAQVAIGVWRPPLAKT